MENFVETNEILRRTGWSLTTFHRRCRGKDFPRPTHRRGKRHYWLRSVVEEALSKLALPKPIEDQPAA